MEQFLYSAYILTEKSKGELQAWLTTNNKVIKEKPYLHHCTIEFGEDTVVNEVIVGTLNTLVIIGYIEDENASVFLVAPSLSTKKYPHITISCNTLISPSYSNLLCEDQSKVQWLDKSIIIQTIITKIYAS